VKKKQGYESESYLVSTFFRYFDSEHNITANLDEMAYDKAEIIQQLQNAIYEFLKKERKKK